MDELDEIPENCPNLIDGVTKKYRKMVEDAMIEFQQRQVEKLQPKILNELSQKIGQEWQSVLSLPELKTSSFDYDVLKTLKSKL